ncbi:hypothetical protein ACLF30_001373 [Cronobacter sakazakii]|uniref:hypothetical protein n=1 Tax=Cronobacter sakazakii TaxID=28141 RepID=UPI000B4A7B10|nr:hypothetical protein [Cronobacter sakazakii]EKA9347266.1 hypothetical protein [Cronobacter sakazakii]EKK3978193.1 hypothetical protein [Cronobacter sakazakii]EKK4043762.1 hypothetical protein [Cronobacter sakazakii]EKY1982217.1 hypothetical protein [Cronobacter sakazakii]EKY1997401.1 hypothetical protein [Cronobacter sakazakii]
MLNTFKEALSSAVNTVAQRIRNPVFGAFVLSWGAFNWKQVLYLLFSDKGIYNKIEYIASTSNWLTTLVFPFASTIFICVAMPWANNIISIMQAKPLDNSDSIENYRKAKQIVRSTRLQRLQAKKDVTYEKVKTGAEKDIQAMKEEIIDSKNRMGELTAELEKKTAELEKKTVELNQSSNTIDELNIKLQKLSHSFQGLFTAYEELKELHEKYRNENPPKPSENQSHGIFSGGIISNGALISDYIKNHEFSRKLLSESYDETKKGKSPILQALEGLNDNKSD